MQFLYSIEDIDSWFQKYKKHNLPSSFIHNFKFVWFFINYYSIPTKG